MRARRMLPVTLLAVVVVACSGSAASQGAGARSAELEIYAAASLKAALLPVQEAYEAATPGISLIVSTDSSAALRAKIEQGAPADVFLSADTANPQALVARGFATGPITSFAANELAVIVPISNPAALETPADLARPGVKIIAAGEQVPITGYATELVGNLALESGYPADFETGYAANIVTREDNVSAVLAKVGLGEGDAGIVYLTDARASEAVATIEVPESASVRATYGGVVVTASSRQEPAASFLAWLAGSGGQAVLSTFGFLPPG